jgi:hypothetical protein
LVTVTVATVEPSVTLTVDVTLPGAVPPVERLVMVMVPPAALVTVTFGSPELTL